LLTLASGLNAGGITMDIVKHHLAMAVAHWWGVLDNVPGNSFDKLAGQILSQHLDPKKGVAVSDTVLVCTERFENLLKYF
jgi:hypothetical protein